MLLHIFSFLLHILCLWIPVFQSMIIWYWLISWPYMSQKLVYPTNSYHVFGITSIFLTQTFRDMGCLNPLQIINPKKMFRRQGGEPFILSVPCGKCANCQTSKSSEYLFRSYYECLETFNADGFVYMVTLTYRDADMPHIRDFDPEIPEDFNFMCFSRRDVRLFSVRLRQHLFKTFGRRIQFKRFLSSEYGTDPNRTHRCHYHVLFYCADSIDPFAFAFAVDACWPHGITDGPTYKPFDYVQDHIFSKRTHLSFDHILNCCNYVAKYVEKDCEFQATIDSRIKCILAFKYKDSHFSEIAKDYKHSLYRNVCQFHLQSSHFGEYGVQYNSLYDVLRTGAITMPFKSSVKPVLSIPLPTYFQRKFFYELVKDFRGLPSWKLTDLGVSFKLSRVIDSIDTLANTFTSWYNDCTLFEQKHINSLLDGRSMNDFAEYILQWRGRIRNFEEIGLRDFPASLDTFVYNQYDTNYGAGFFANYTSSIDSQWYGKKCLSCKWFGDYKTGFSKTQPAEFDLIPISQFIKTYVITDSFSHRFRDFDSLFSYFCDIAYRRNYLKQQAYQRKQELRKYYKSLKSLIL